MTTETKLSEKEKAQLAETKGLAAQGEKITGKKSASPTPAATKKAPTPKVAKTTLLDQPVGTKDGNFELMAKNGAVQLWKGKVGFGVVRIKDNHYVTILPVRATEDAAKAIYQAEISKN